MPKLSVAVGSPSKDDDSVSVDPTPCGIDADREALERQLPPELRPSTWAKSDPARVRVKFPPPLPVPDIPEHLLERVRYRRMN